MSSEKQPYTTSDYLIKTRALLALKAACCNIRLLDFLDFKKMVEKEDPVLEDGISISSLYYDWPEFYNLNNTISIAIAAFSKCPIEAPQLPVLQLEYKEIFQHINQLKEFIPEWGAGTESINVDTAFYDNQLNTVYSYLRSFIIDLKETYLPYLRRSAVELKNTPKQSEISIAGKNREMVTLMQFMEDYCQAQSHSLLQSRKKSLQKAHQVGKLQLPELSIPWQRGQSKHYYANELIERWFQYCRILPNLPQLDITKVKKKVANVASSGESETVG